MNMPASPMPTIFDPSVLKSYSRGDYDWEKNFIGIFLEQTRTQLESLRVECTDGENAKWGEITHAMKGCAANIGAEALRSACHDAQLLTETSAHHRNNHFARIEAAYFQLEQLLETSYPPAN